MASTLIFYDAAYPPSQPPETDGVCFYIGGDTPHVWTEAEVNAQPAYLRLPVFVRSNPASASATEDVVAAVSRLHALGVPEGSLVTWDLETAVDPAYILAVYHSLTAAGYKLIVYGSQSVVAGNRNPAGWYWGADWTGEPHIAAGNVMTQYLSNNSYDLSVAVSDLPFWNTKSHAPSPVTPPPPSSEPEWQVSMMQALPELQNGASGASVRTVQGLCVARGHSIAVDGAFGPQTEAAVKAVQSAAKVSVDGVVGPETWPALLGV